MFKGELKYLIEPHFYKDLKLIDYKIKTVRAIELLTNNRLDLAFKLLYLEMKDIDVFFAKEIYKEHIRAFSLGKFVEPGSEEKTDFDIFLKSFYRTYSDIKQNGFDKAKTVIPLSNSNSIANGAHRVASAIYLNKYVDCVQLEIIDHVYDYNYFYSRNIPSDTLDVVTTKFVEYAENIYIALVWPTAKGSDSEIERIIPNIVYRKDIQLNSNGAHNILSQIYYGEDWLGNIENNYKGTKAKLVECFKTHGSVRVITFQADSLVDVLKIKDRIRKVFNVGKHSIHITDTKEEAIRLARVVFNSNGIHFLNHAKPNKYISIHSKISKYKSFLNKNGSNIKDLIMDDEFTLALYGIRECVDARNISNFDGVHLDEVLDLHNENRLESIYNPSYFFYFDDLKFVSFSQLYKKKNIRCNEQDMIDCEIMEALIESYVFKQLMSKFKQNFSYTKIKLTHNVLELLRCINLYSFARKIYRITKRKK
jgi:hypothetical protein